jgi:hypothetical protein
MNAGHLTVDMRSWLETSCEASFQYPLFEYQAFGDGPPP